MSDYSEYDSPQTRAWDSWLGSMPCKSRPGACEPCSCSDAAKNPHCMYCLQSLPRDFVARFWADFRRRAQARDEVPV